MFGLVTGFGGWLLGLVLKWTGGSVIEKALAYLQRSDDGAIRLEEIRARAVAAQNHEDTERLRVVTAAKNERQSAKMNSPVFWALIIIMLGAPAAVIWGITLYNFFWWEHGLFPMVSRNEFGQLVGWSIADYPPSIKPWIEKSVEWLYDPIAAPAAVGTAWAAGYLTRRR